MGKAVKKMGRKTVFSLLSLGAFVLAVAFRLLFGGSHLTISQLDSKANDVFHKADVFATPANADVPIGEGGGEGSGGGGSGSSG